MNKEQFFYISSRISIVLSNKFVAMLVVSECTLISYLNATVLSFKGTIVGIGVVCKSMPFVMPYASLAANGVTTFTNGIQVLH